MAKPFADKAAANAAMIQAAADYAATQTRARAKFQADQTKIHGQLQQGAFDARVEAAQAAQERQKDAAAQGPPEDVAGPPVQQVPLPQPGSAAANAGSGTLQIDPSQVSGGGGIQAATGGLGRAGGDQGGSVGNVPPVIQTQQQTTNQGVRYAQTPDGLGFQQVPTYNQSNTTLTRPNVLSAYEAGALANQQSTNAIRLQIANNIRNNTLKDKLAESLGYAVYARTTGALDQKGLNSMVESAAQSLSENGMSRSDLRDVLSRADVGSNKVITQEDREKFSALEPINKLIQEQQGFPVGSRPWRQLDDRIKKLNTPTLGPLVDLLLKPQVIKMDAEYKGLVEQDGLSKNLYSMVGDHPEYFGATGSLARAATKGLGGLRDVAGLLGGENQVRKVYQSAIDTLNNTRSKLQDLERWNPAEAAAYSDYMKQFQQPANGEQLVGTIESLENALAVNLASGALNRVTVEGIKEFKRDFLNLTGFTSGDVAKGKLLQLQRIIDSRKTNAKIDYDRRHLSVPNYVSPEAPARPMVRSTTPLQGVPVIDPASLR